MLRKNKKLVEGDGGNEYRKSGSFVNKPQRGWLHPDSNVMGPGVVYAVQYLGCITVHQSIRTLEYDMRTHATNEAIWRVLSETGVNSAFANSKRKKNKDIDKILATKPDLRYSKQYINLTISTASLTLVTSDHGDFIANHQLQSISFASGGDPDTYEYVAYVAKDNNIRRACHVLRCSDGLAQDVINTIGQAFELRFKEYLKNPPKAVTPPDRTEPLFHDGKSRWGDDEPEYYNNLSKTRADIIEPSSSQTNRVSSVFPQPPPPSVSRKNDYVNNNVQQATTSGIDPYHFSNRALPVPKQFDDHNYVNTQPISSDVSDGPVFPSHKTYLQMHHAPLKPPRPIPDNYKPSRTVSQQAHFPFVSQQNPINSGTPHNSKCHSPHLLFGAPSSRGQVPAGKGTGALAIAAAIGISKSEAADPANRFDDFDMKPFVDPTNQTPQKIGHPSSDVRLPPAVVADLLQSLSHEPWFHPSLSRKQAESILLRDGDFLVRESSAGQGQFVLSGVKDGFHKHLLLVDPSGTVRTKDRQFDSVRHLISYHQDNNLPIVSAGSILLLRQPVFRKYEKC